MRVQILKKYLRKAAVLFKGSLTYSWRTNCSWTTQFKRSPLTKNAWQKSLRGTITHVQICCWPHLKRPSIINIYLSFNELLQQRVVLVISLCIFLKCDPRGVQAQSSGFALSSIKALIGNWCQNKLAATQSNPKQPYFQRCQSKSLIPSWRGVFFNAQVSAGAGADRRANLTFDFTSHAAEKEPHYISI